MYTFGRDGTIPGPDFMHNVDHRWRSPICAGSFFYRDFAFLNRKRRLLVCFCFCTTVAGSHTHRVPSCLGPSVGSPVASSVSPSLSTIGLRIYFLQYAIRLPNPLPPSANDLLKGIPIALHVVYAERFIREHSTSTSSPIQSQSLPRSGSPSCRSYFASQIRAQRSTLNPVNP